MGTPNDRRDDDRSSLSLMLPGAAGGVTRALLGQPFDCIKTRLQVLGRGSLGSVGLPTHMVYNSALDCLRKAVVHEGPLSLYKGASAPLLGNMLLLGIHFPTFNKVRARLGQLRGSSEFSALDTWAAGGCAGAVGSLISSPSELVRTRMTLVRRAALLAVGGNSAAAAAVGAAAASEQYSGSWDCLRRVVRRHGLLGLYRGYCTTLLRDVQGYGWFFLAYEATVHAMLQPGQSRDQLSFNQIVTAGIMAGFGLWGSMFPIDTIKSKIQADSFTRPLYSGFRDCLRWTLASEGRAGLWRGASAALLRVVPVNAAVFLAVEGTRGLLARQGQGSTAVLAADRAAELPSRVHA